MAKREVWMVEWRKKGSRLWRFWDMSLRYRYASAQAKALTNSVDKFRAVRYIPAPEAKSGQR